MMRLAGFLMMVLCLIGSGAGAGADIFEQARPADTALREALREDRRQYYLMASGTAYQKDEKIVNNMAELAASGLTRPSGLYDTEAAFNKYLKKELMSGQVPGSDLGLRHPLLLLEYSSPVMADVLKHYRIAAYERLAMEQARLARIESSTENRIDRLASQSLRECLKGNEAKGLVEAMRLCQRSMQPFDALTSVDGSVSLSDGRRRIHVLAQALQRLGFEKSRIEKVVDLTGDQVMADDGYAVIFPKKTFDGALVTERQRLAALWKNALDKFRSTRKAAPSVLEDLSLPGIPVTAATLSDLTMLDDGLRELAVLKLSSVLAYEHTALVFRQALSYLDLCLGDPVLIQEYQRIIADKRLQLQYALDKARMDIDGTKDYKALLVSAAQAADMARARIQERGTAELAAPVDAGYMLND